MTFTPHINNITAKATHKLNVLRTLTNTNFGQQKETMKIVYKQFLRSIINYASPAWFPTLAKQNKDKLITIQNKALRIVTGCLKTTPAHHLEAETEILPIITHMDMIGTQFYSKTRAPSHPLHQILTPVPTPRTKKTSPSDYYSNLYNN